MRLSGTFDVLSFPEVLRLVAAQRITGRLSVQTGEARVTVTVVDGSAVGADGFVRGGGAGQCTSWPRRLEGLCVEALRTARGHFQLERGEAGAPDRSSPPVGLLEALEGARARAAELERANEIIGSPNVELSLVADLPSELLVLDREDWETVASIQRGVTAGRLARRLGVDIIELARRVERLAAAGVLRMDTGPRAVATPPAAERPTAAGPGADGQAPSELTARLTAIAESY